MFFNLICMKGHSMALLAVLSCFSTTVVLNTRSGRIRETPGPLGVYHNLEVGTQKTDREINVVDDYQTLTGSLSQWLTLSSK